MIPSANNRSVTLGGAQASASFEISQENSAHIMSILREGLYSDRILAILREYGSNAWDAHRSVGKHDLPIKITLPEPGEHTLRIRDYGPGLSHDDVFNVYTQYGKSTKRGSDDVVGMLGIGSKSGFAYSDTFTITSWHGGYRRVYAACLGEDEKGAINLLDETPCDPSETGVEIQIATKPEDRYEFTSTARRLFRHMTPRPEINTELPALPEERTVLTHGVISPGQGEWIAVMGCVPYRVNLAQLDAKQISPALSHMSGELTFNIGGVQMSASREELKYTAQTKAALVQKANDLVDEFVTQALKVLEAGLIDGWQSRLQVRVLSQLDLPLPDKWKPFAEGFAKVTYQPGDFTITHNKSAVTRLAIDADTRLLIDDTGNDLSGYTSLGVDDYVVRSTGKTTEELRAALDAALVASGLVGVKIGLLSTLYWNAPAVPVKRKSNPKYRSRMFQLSAKHDGKAPWSDNWEPVLRVPTTDDVYVVIDGFKPEGYNDFWSHHATDKQLADAFGATMPTVHGYRTTPKKPILNTPEGTHYRDWRGAFHRGLLTPERIVLIDAYWRAHPEGLRYHDAYRPMGAELTWLVEQLGDGHMIIKLFVAAAEAAALLDDHNDQAIRSLALRNGLTFAKSNMALATDVVRKRYPLLSRTGLRNLWKTSYYADDNVLNGNHEREEWVEYVQMRDARDAVPVRDNVVQLKSVP